ncbi:hypothetical protein ACF068_10660 [Streptomyces sp. NPDC016309]|uniref:hypothetical protein n=1 Tax=Streptomyces sp. NPDC016309 TaxID=3364965 RepID=UPI0036F5E277
MRLRRITPLALAALLSVPLPLSGCTTVSSSPSAARPGLAPAGERRTAPVPEAPPPLPAPAREELAVVGPASGPPAHRAPGGPADSARAGAGAGAGAGAPDGTAPRGRASQRWAEHRPGGAPPTNRRPAPRAHRPAARAERPVEAPRKTRPEPARKAPLPRRSVGMRDLCRASHGVADPSIVSLCHRAYG